MKLYKIILHFVRVSRNLVLNSEKILKNCRFCRWFLLFYSIFRYFARENANLKRGKPPKKEEMVTYELNQELRGKCLKCFESIFWLLLYTLTFIVIII